MKKKSNRWHVYRDSDIGTHIYSPWLLKEHAERLAEILNEIETHRIEVLWGGSRKNGDGHFFTVKEEKSSKSKRQ